MTEIKMDEIQIIAFDADDTLWVNEPFFLETENKFCDMLEDFLPHHSLSRELLTIEIQNLKHYGYGVRLHIIHDRSSYHDYRKKDRCGND